MTQAVIGALRVNLSMNSAEFNQGIDQAERRLGRFNNTARITGGVIGRVLGLALGIAIASTINAARHTEVYKRNLEAATKAIDDFSEAAAVKAAPAMAFLARNMELVVSAGGAIAGAKLGALIGALGGPGTAAAGGVIGLLAGALIGYASSVEIAGNETEAATSKIKEALPTWEKFHAQFRETGMDALARMVEAEKEAAKVAKEAAEEQERAERKHIDALIQRQEELESMRMAMEDAVATPMEQYATRLEEIALLEQQAGLAAETASRARVQAAAMAASSWASVASQMGSALSTMFAENKGFAIAEAVINTAQAITRTMAQYGFTPIGIAAMAAAAASGAAQIATIARTQPGSSASPRATRTAAPRERDGGGGTTERIVNVSLTGGNMFGQEAVRGLIMEINKAVGDGATIRVA